MQLYEVQVVVVDDPAELEGTMYVVAINKREARKAARIAALETYFDSYLGYAREPRMGYIGPAYPVDLGTPGKIAGHLTRFV